MSVQEIPRRIAAASLVVFLVLGQAGSVCAIHCLLEHGMAPGAHGGPALVHAAGHVEPDAAGGSTGSDSAGTLAFCNHEASQVSSMAVQASVGPMAAALRATLAAVPTSLIAGHVAVPLPAYDVILLPHRPPPRA